MYQSETSRLVIEDPQKYRILQDWDRVPSCFETEVKSGADPGFFLGGGALVSCSTSTPINHIVFLFFFAEYQLY